MAEEYNVPWKIEGDFVVTGNGKYHKSEIEKIVDQRDHEINNLRMVNQILESGILIDEKQAPRTTGRNSKKEFVNKFLKAI